MGALCEKNRLASVVSVKDTFGRQPGVINKTNPADISYRLASSSWIFKAPASDR
jgi:hypothetical protein